MTLNVNLNGVQNTLVTSYHTLSAQLGEWLGRAVSIIKLGSEKAQPHVQDKRIAVVSLIAVNLLLIEVGLFFSKIAGYFLPDNAFRDSVGVVVGLGTVIGGVAAYKIYLKLPLSTLAVIGISLGTIFLRALFEK